MKSNIAITIPNFEIENKFIEIQLVAGVYELIEINNAIKQIITDSDYDLVQIYSRLTPPIHNKY